MRVAAVSLMAAGRGFLSSLETRSGRVGYFHLLFKSTEEVPSIHLNCIQLYRIKYAYWFMQLCKVYARIVGDVLVESE